MPEDIDPVLIQHEIDRTRRYLAERYNRPRTDPIRLAIIACLVGAVALFATVAIAIIWS